MKAVQRTLCSCHVNCSGCSGLKDMRWKNFTPAAYLCHAVPADQHVRRRASRPARAPDHGERVLRYAVQQAARGRHSAHIASHLSICCVARPRSAAQPRRCST